MEYMTKVDGVLGYFYRSVMSYRPESDIKLLRFELSVGYPIYQKDVQSNLFLDSIEAPKRKEVNMVHSIYLHTLE